jgi:hypothetical protein
MTAYNCEVSFFDSFTMSNRTERGRLIERSETMATVEVDSPIRKRVRVPVDEVAEYLEPITQ